MTFRPRRTVTVVSRLVLALATLSSAACGVTSPVVDVKAEEAVIRKLTLDWAAAEASNNIDSALAFLWDDATMQPPNAGEVHGRQAIRAGYEMVKFVSLTLGDARVTVSAGGDLAAIWGPLKVVIETPGGQTSLDSKFVAVWQKRGGTWKVIENSWNDSGPAILVQVTPTGPAATTTQEINRDVWSVFAATVAADDIARMGEVYFPNAVLVNPRETAPITAALDRWGKDMVAAKAKGNRATVEFRFSRRQDGASTAFETGIFKYTVIEKSGAANPKFYPFESLLGKSNGKWRVLMERQFAEVTQAEWDKLPRE